MRMEYFLFVYHTTSILAKLGTWCFKHSGDRSCSLLVNPSHTDKPWERRNCVYIYIYINIYIHIYIYIYLTTLSKRCGSNPEETLVNLKKSWCSWYLQSLMSSLNSSALLLPGHYNVSAFRIMHYYRLDIMDVTKSM